MYVVAAIIIHFCHLSVFFRLSIPSIALFCFSWDRLMNFFNAAFLHSFFGRLFQNSSNFAREFLFVILLLVLLCGGISPPLGGVLSPPPWQDSATAHIVIFL
jgi:hypothetical protein